MRKFTLATPDFSKTWKVELKPREIARFDNGHLISIGLIVGEDVQPSTVKRWEKSGKAVPTNPDIEKHSACQSRCILRGDLMCQW